MEVRRFCLLSCLLVAGLMAAPFGLGCGGSSNSGGTGNSNTIVMNPLAGSTLPSGTVATLYTQTFVASGGLPPFTFTVVGTTPDGLALASFTPEAASLSGTPTTAGTTILKLQVVDATNANVANVQYSLTIK